MFSNRVDSIDSENAVNELHVRDDDDDDDGIQRKYIYVYGIPSTTFSTYLHIDLYLFSRTI